MPITYDDKVAIITNPNPEENKWTAENANEVKTAINDLEAKLRASRQVTAADSIVQSDDNTIIKFNSATPINFTLDQLAVNSKASFVNYGAGAVTFINGSGVTLVGDPILPAAAGTSYPTAFLFYDTITAPRIIGGPGSSSASYYAASTTGVNTYVATLSPALSALSSGVEIAVKFSDASTGSSTLNVNGLGAKKMYSNPTTQIGSGDITDEQTYEFYYDAALDSAAGGWMRIGGGAGASFTVASSAEINTGTENAKGITPLSLQGSKYETQYRLRSFAASTSAANTYTANLSPAITTYGSGGLLVSIKFTNANTGAATLNLNGLGALTITRNDGSALQAGDIGANFTGLLQYDGTNFILVNARSAAPSAWTTSAAGLVERSTQAEAQAIITQFLAGGTTGLSGSRTVSELELLDVLNSLGIFPQAKTNTASGSGGTSGTATFAMSGIRWAKYIASAYYTGNVTITLTTAGSSDPFEGLEFIFAITGAITVRITFDSNVRFPDGTPGWNYAGKYIDVVNTSGDKAYRLIMTKSTTYVLAGLSTGLTL